MKKRTQKLLALATVLTMGAGVLASCGNNAASGEKKAEGKTTISLAIWDENQRAMTESLAEAYNKSHPDVTVEVQLTPNKEYWTKLEASVAGGNAPDVFWLNVLHLDSFVEGGVLADLTDAITKSDIKDNFPESLVNNYVRDGKYYAVPKDFDTNALWYNKAIFDKAGEVSASTADEGESSLLIISIQH